MRKNRSGDILNYFVKQDSASFTLKELAERFGISERQVKNYIRQINAKSAPFAMIESDASGAYHAAQGYTAYMKLFKNPELLPSERVSVILSRLLTSKTPLNIFDLADELYVSRPTVEADLVKVRKIISSYDITLTLANDLLSLQGTEKAFRKVTSYMITTTEYDGFLPGDKQLFIKEDYHLDYLRTHLTEIFDDCHFVYNDYSLNNILLHLTITVDRIKHEYYIENQKFGGDSSPLETQAADRVANFLEEEYQIRFSELERENLALFLSCNLAIVDYKVVDPQRIEDLLSDDCTELAHRILDQVTDYYYLDPFDDLFFTRFVLHINNLMKRLRSNFSAHNPLYEEIVRTYPLLFDTAVFAAKIIKDETGYSINQDEISLIALHIGSFIESSQVNKNKVSAIYVYTDYHGMHQKNVSTIQNRYGDRLNLQYNISILDYRNTPITADIIISEVPLPNAIPVSPFITQEQLRKIEDVIDEKIRGKEQETFRNSLQDLFTEELFFRNLTGTDKYEVIQKACEQLKQADYTDDLFMEAVYTREQLASTCFIDNMAIPHAISQNVKKSFISFTTYDKPQIWDSKSISLMVFIGISYTERKTFRSVFNQLVKLFEKQSVIQAIAGCKTYEEVLELLQNPE